MNLDSRYIVNSPEVVSDFLDGEVIIIQLSTGIYYSAQDSGAAIWEFLMQGASLRQIIDRLIVQFDGDPLAISFEISPFISELVEQQLIIPATGDLPTLASPPVEIKRPFSLPKLEIYRDMQNLLIIDPIHEVDSSKGWPVASNTNG